MRKCVWIMNSIQGNYKGFLFMYLFIFLTEPPIHFLLSILNIIFYVT